MIKKKKTLNIRGLSLLFTFLLLSGGAEKAFCHILDEVSIRSVISLGDEYISLTLKIDAGMMYGQYYLETLDPDRNRIFEQPDIEKFSEYIVSGLRLRMDEESVAPEFVGVTFSSFEEFIAGLCFIRLDYQIPYPEDLESKHTFFYENCLEAEVAIYAMNVGADNNSDINIGAEDRNEMLQDLTTITFGKGLAPKEQILLQAPAIIAEAPEVSAAPENSKPLKASEGSSTADSVESVSTLSTEFAGSARLIDRIRAGDFNPFVLFALAVAIGFLHAFTPGHGKSLVGAYLVANRGTVIQAIGLGIIVTLTHTLSIYVFGGFASIAAYFFMPSRIIPMMTVVAGVLVVFIGLWSGIRRFLGLEVDHAHILPNLKVLKEDHVNVLVDGSAVESSEYLAIESGEEHIQQRLKAAGAEGINICSPGCETHRILPYKVAERQSIQLMKMAVETGAVGAVISGRKNILKQVRRIKSNLPVGFYTSVDSPEDAERLLDNAILNFSGRGEIIIPEDRLSWKKLIPLGIAGGAVPCPDALAILLISLSIGQLALGLGIVFAFSAGLAAALVLIGTLIVFSNKIVAGTRQYQKIAGFIPYLSALFLTGIGLYMIIRSI